MPDFPWKPIEKLSERGGSQALYQAWREAKTRLQLVEFNHRLLRRLSIETGILEQLYDLDRGTTEALVVTGFLEDLVSPSSTNIEPGRLIDILRDHDAAAQLVVDGVANMRPLTKGLMHELQAIVTRHQSNTTAIDGLGRRFEIPLLKGRFKEQPNNPKRPDGSVHGYCPPLHVEAEVENLLAWLAEYSNEDPVLVAAWLHHRFTQIHPYQDGNGRLARALTALVLLRAGLLPVVIDRDLRTEYIAALESADQSDLTPLAELFARLQRNAILQALSVEFQARVTGTSTVIAALTVKLEKRNSAELSVLRHANSIAEELRGIAEKTVARSLAELESALRQLGAPVTEMNPNQPLPWFKEEVRRVASEAQKFANLSEDHSAVSGLISIKLESLKFIVSLHHVGRSLTGIMEAMAYSEGPSERLTPRSAEPFVFTHLSQLPDLEAPFAQWLDAALAVAINEFADRL